MPSKQCGIPRDWSKSEQLSVSEKISLKSGSVSTSARFINSVSDLYAADEIDALLDEIRDLEPISVGTDDLQDFEIDGSVSRLPYNSMTCDSRTSVHSWDSHALYSHHNRMDDIERRSVGGPVSIYCDSNHLKTPIGILRIILLVSENRRACY
ncbi:unnamed protein product [Allacma fusca]|uniref:Uncharacterized protein n=1 Tax=Allacma fusca TaxID=39272 RepID=A0A8J2KQV9_9HEXA|nr:unnamed protein product [Allacma fusca]